MYTRNYRIQKEERQEIKPIVQKEERPDLKPEISAEQVASATEENTAKDTENDAKVCQMTNPEAEDVTDLPDEDKDNSDGCTVRKKRFRAVRLREKGVGQNPEDVCQDEPYRDCCENFGDGCVNNGEECVKTVCDGAETKDICFQSCTPLCKDTLLILALIVMLLLEGSDDILIIALAFLLF